MMPRFLQYSLTPTETQKVSGLFANWHAGRCVSCALSNQPIAIASFSHLYTLVH